jgi:hypothetical protein
MKTAFTIDAATRNSRSVVVWQRNAHARRRCGGEKKQRADCRGTGCFYVGHSVIVVSLTRLTSCASSSSKTQFYVCWTSAAVFLHFSFFLSFIVKYVRQINERPVIQTYNFGINFYTSCSPSSTCPLPHFYTWILAVWRRAANMKCENSHTNC